MKLIKEEIKPTLMTAQYQYMLITQRVGGEAFGMRRQLVQKIDRSVIHHIGDSIENAIS